MKATSFVVWLGAAALLGAIVAPAVPVGAASTSPSTASAVLHIDGDRTRAAFEHGQPLVETDSYKVHASRRTAPGMAEIHTRDTDIIYVLGGRATLVTGGRALDAAPVAPFEIRGSSIEGGAARRLAAGDVVIVPNGTPHWFSEVDGPFLYYVVKTTAPSPADADDAVIDLATRKGLAAVNGQWRYSDVKIVEAEFRAPDADGQPTGAPVRTNDYTPKAGAADFDDSSWQRIDPEALTARRGGGRLSFNWYRLSITVPERIGAFNPAGSTAIFETAVDDYAEVWVDGELPRAIGQSGGSMIAGWNAPNRLVIARNVQPGQRIQLAIFGANGPLSNPPSNFIWMRYARVRFAPGERGPIAVAPQEVNVEVVRKDPALDAIVGPNPKLHKLAEGFAFTEGPVWDAARRALLFSDPNRNTIYTYSQEGVLSVFRTPSGYDGADIAEYKQPGSNGLALDAHGRLTINEHGNRRISRLEPDGRVTVLVDRFQGKRLNSPNDLVYRSDGMLFFTDPPFGLPKVFADERKELPFSGVYALRDGQAQLLTGELDGPNGIAFSPDERYLYVGNWDEKRKVVMRYDVARDGSLSNGLVFVDMTNAPGEDAIDGIKVDIEGNVYVSGPGGLWVLDASGRHLGTILTPRHVHNMAWGDDDGKTLYLCARDRLYRMRLNVGGRTAVSTER